MSERVVPQALRGEVSRLAHGCCEYCLSQVDFSPAPFSVEHIHPRSRGGASGRSNLAFACQGCNGHKAAKTHAMDPNTGEMTPLFHPRQQRWQDHFAWESDFTKIVGRTPGGRATVMALRLNRPRLQRFRQVLRAFGCHPPAALPEPAP